MTRLEQYDAAAIELMKIPIRYPDRYLECASALDLAVEALRKSEKVKEMQQQTMATSEQQKKPEKKSSGVFALL